MSVQIWLWAGKPDIDYCQRQDFPPVHHFQSALRPTQTLKPEKKIYPITGPDRPLGLQEVETTRISRQPAHEGGKFVSPTHRPP